MPIWYGYMKITHSKYKNTGLLFDLLVRQVTSEVMEGKTTSRALDLMKKYFNPKKELGKELSLYRSFFTTNNLSESKAFKFVDLIIEQRKKLNNNKLSEEKYNLVKEIKDNYDLEKFLSPKIPEYKVYASIYKTFVVETTNAHIAEVEDAINARFTICEHITKSPKPKETKDELLEEFRAQNDDLRLLSYKILVDKFNKKYENLSMNQKDLLREYINNISDSDNLREYVNKQVPLVKRSLETKIKSVDDVVTQIKLKEVISQLETVMKGRQVRDNQITALMIAFQIDKELDNVK